MEILETIFFYLSIGVPLLFLIIMIINIKKVLIEPKYRNKLIRFLLLSLVINVTIFGSLKMFNTKNSNDRKNEFEQSEEVSNLDVDSILTKLNKKAKNSGKLNFAEPATTDETKDALYELPDDYGKSYFYRGDVQDNYVKFAGFYWRIIRVNGDGSVRLLYDGTEAHVNSDTFKDRWVFDSAFNKNYDDNKYVGYMFSPNEEAKSTIKEEAQTNDISSTIKMALEKWYVSNLADYDKAIADSVFCYDRSMPGKELTGWSNDTGLGYGKNNTAYGSFMRVAMEKANEGKYKPQFTCDNKNDAFTKSDTQKGNGVLGEKIGLITMDEAWAGGTGNAQHRTLNTSNYLYKNGPYWTGSPSNYNTNAIVFIVNYGRLSGMDYVYNNWGVVPVINLTPEYFYNLVGDGTIGNEYRVE